MIGGSNMPALLAITPEGERIYPDKDGVLHCSLDDTIITFGGGGGTYTGDPRQGHAVSGLVERECKAAVVIAGAAYQCDQPLTEDGTHGAFAHGNREAQAIWLSHVEARGTP